jgi:hypothetical protein
VTADAENPAWAASWFCLSCDQPRNGRATIFHKPQDYFGLRLFQTFQELALSSIEGFNRCAHQLRMPFQLFQLFQSSFQRFAKFKSCQASASSKRSKVPVVPMVSLQP